MQRNVKIDFKRQINDHALLVSAIYCDIFHIEKVKKKYYLV